MGHKYASSVRGS